MPYGGSSGTLVCIYFAGWVDNRFWQWISSEIFDVVWMDTRGKDVVLYYILAPW